jgi:hypothetical protein
LCVTVALAVLGLVRGWSDAGGWHLDWFQGYTDALNTWRVSKSIVFVLLLMPLLRRATWLDRALAHRRFAAGMAAGALVVALAVVSERAAYPGLLDISAHYRTTAWFWEMHVGGAAIDAYVVLCTPFVAWTVWASRRWWQWLLAAAFSLLWAYVCLTTFSRGAVGGIAVGLLVAGALLPASAARWRSLARWLGFVVGVALLLALALEGAGYAAAGLVLLALAAALWLHWRTRGRAELRALALGLLGLGLVFEAIVMIGPDSFMRARISGNLLDYESRRVHWARGVGLLSGADAWLWGLGAGRLPENYDARAPRGEFSGTANLASEAPGSAAVRIAGPRTRARLGGLFGLTQRVPLHPQYTLRLDARSAGAMLMAKVCESHLLYDRNCQAAWVTVPPSDAGQWVDLMVPLDGPALDAGDWFAPRQGVLTLAVVDAGTSAEIDNVVLAAPDGSPLLRNGDFSAGLAHWLPAAQVFFVPWHIDNLYLELLVERGVAGLSLFLLLAGWAAWRLAQRSVAGDDVLPWLAASLIGVLALGLVSSVFDVPRVALLLGWIVASGLLRYK